MQVASRDDAVLAVILQVVASIGVQPGEHLIRFREVETPMVKGLATLCPIELDIYRLFVVTDNLLVSHRSCTAW